jgi:hypothetical protein
MEALTALELPPRDSSSAHLAQVHCAACAINLRKRGCAILGIAGYRDARMTARQRGYAACAALA